jgi:hypothetical protein
MHGKTVKFTSVQQALICSLQTIGTHNFCEIPGSQDDVCEDFYFRKMPASCCRFSCSGEHNYIQSHPVGPLVDVLVVRNLNVI